MSKTNQLKAGAVLNYVVIVLNVLVELLYEREHTELVGGESYRKT